MNDLCVLINDNSPDLILITESWCNEGVSNSLLEIDGYNLETELRLDRTDTQAGIGGGLLVYTRFGIKITPSNVNSDFNQFCSFSVKCHSQRDFYVSLIYRSPNSSEENNNKLYDLIETHPENMFIVGDFNLPKINCCVSVLIHIFYGEVFGLHKSIAKSLQKSLAIEDASH